MGNGSVIVSLALGLLSEIEMRGIQLLARREECVQLLAHALELTGLVVDQGQGKP